MLKFKKVFSLFLCLFFFAQNGFSSSASGTTVFEFLKIPANASQAGYGGITSFTAASAPQNPAMIPFSTPNVLSATAASYVQDITYLSFSYTKFYKKSGFNLAYSGLNYGDFERYVENSSGDYEHRGTFSANDGFVNAGAGIVIGDYFTAGASVKYIWQTIDGSGISGAAFNLSGVYLSGKDWHASAGIENLGFCNRKDYALPSSFYGSAVSYIENYLVVGGELRVFSDGAAWLKGAGELNYKEIFFARAGYSLALNRDAAKLGDWYERNLSLGFGVEYNFFTIDLAWLPYGKLGSATMVTVQYVF